MRQCQHRRHGGIDGCHHGVAHAIGGGANQHDFILVFTGGNFSLNHIEERIDRESAVITIAVVEESLHLRFFIGFNGQASQLNI